MPEPRITVLMTLYNKGPFVTEAVASVLASTFTDFELLVVDDASTDDGPERVQAITDPRIRIMRHGTNSGRARNANRGFAAARGEYIAILDADDRMSERRLEKQAAFLDAHPEVGACGTCAQLMGERGHVVCWPATDAEARGLLLFEDPMLYGTMMIRRSLLEEHALRCPEHWDGPGMDYLFLLDVAACTKLANLQEPLTSYRLGPNNFRHGRDSAADSARIVEAALRRFGVMAATHEVRAHLMLLRRRQAPASEQEVRELNAWVARLLSLNQLTKAFTPQVFEQRLRAEQDHVFCLLADRAPLLALLHARLSGGWGWGRARYFAAARLRAAFR